MQALANSETVSIAQPSAGTYARRTVTVDFLYLDTESCDRCRGTETALESALERVEPVLDAIDVSVTVRDVHVSSLAAAESTQLAVSPTIRIDGRDIQPNFIESACESCGDLCACEGDVDCRLWRYRGEEHTIAPVGLLVKALVQAIAPHQMEATESRGAEAYQLSSNVREFVEGSGDEETDGGCDC